MAWNCETFERRLSEYAVGALSDGEVRLAEIHLRDCDECRFLLAALEVWSTERASAHSDISASVLARTTGPSCRQAIKLLCQFVDEELGPLDHALVASHLDRCVSCAELCAELLDLKTTLPSLAEIEPDIQLLPRVVASTRDLRKRREGLLGKIYDFFAAQAQRPRFSFEAAYVATLLLVLLFGTPISPARDASQELVAAFQGEQGIVSMAGDRLDSWRDGASRTLAMTGAVSTRLWKAEEVFETAVTGLTDGVVDKYETVRERALAAADSAGLYAKDTYQKIKARRAPKR